MRAGSMFAGCGGLDLGLIRAGFQVVWHAEIHPQCSTVLDERFPGVPNLGDVTAVQWTDDHAVDVIAAGFPCQPVSVAGKRLAQDDPRWLWPHVAAAVRVLRPRHVLLENVAGLLTRGMGDVLGDLASLGYDARWSCLRAADVGAPHGRLRWFCVATDAQLVGDDTDRRLRRRDPRAHGRSAPASVSAGAQVAYAANALADGPGAAADADGEHRDERRVAAPGETTGGRPPAFDPGRRGAPRGDGAGDAAAEPAAADAARVGSERQEPVGGVEGRRSRVDGEAAADPGDDGRWGGEAGDGADGGVGVARGDDADGRGVADRGEDGARGGAASAADAEGARAAGVQGSDGGRAAVGGPGARAGRRDRAGDPAAGVQVVGGGAGVVSVGGADVEAAADADGGGLSHDAERDGGRARLEAGRSAHGDDADGRRDDDRGAAASDADGERGKPGGGGRASGGDHARPDAQERDGDGLVGTAQPGQVTQRGDVKAASDAAGCGRDGGPQRDTGDGAGGREAVGAESNAAAGDGGSDEGDDLGDAVQWGVYEPAVRRWESILGRPAPAPTDARGRLTPEFVEWMMGFPAGWTAAHGVKRAKRLFMLGNAVQVQCAQLIAEWLLEIDDDLFAPPEAADMLTTGGR